VRRDVASDAKISFFANKSGAHFSGKPAISNKSCNGACADAALIHEIKVEKLRLTKSDDPIQQLQSDIISDFYDAIRDPQVMVDPLILLLPDV
jgi:hypothetical protein